MAADTSTIDALLKDNYGPAVVPQIITDFPLLSFFNEGDMTGFDGRNIVYPARTNRNRGVMATAERGNLPTAGQTQNVEVRIPMRYVHGRIQLTGQAIKLSRTNEGAFVRAMQNEMDDLVDALRLQLEFYLFHDGRGVRCLVNGAANSVTQTVDTCGGDATTGAVATHGNRYLNIGDWIAFVNPATGTLRQTIAFQITGIAAAGTTITLSAAANTTTNDLIVKAYGSDAALAIENTEFLKPPMGLLGMIDDGTYVQVYNNVSRATYPVWQSTVIAGVGALSLDILQRGLDVASQIGSAKINDLVSHQSTARSYATLLEADRRYTGGDLRNPDGGTKRAKGGELAFGGIPMHTFYHCPYGTIFGVDRRHLTKYEAQAGQWVDEDGAVLHRVSDQDAFEATYRWYCNYADERPNSAVRWEGINSTIVVAHIV